MSKTILSAFVFLAAASAMLAVPQSGLAEEVKAAEPATAATISMPSAAPAQVPPALILTSDTKPLPPLMHHRAFSVGALGLAGGDDRGALVYGEYEKMMGRRFAMFTRLEWLDFKHEADRYREKGRGRGLEFGGRFYLWEQEAKSVYIGAGLGVWRFNWYWKDDVGTPFETSDSRRSRVTSFEVQGGGKFRIGKGKMYLNPQFQIGSFSPVHQRDPLEFGSSGYVSAGVALGTAW